MTPPTAGCPSGTRPHPLVTCTASHSTAPAAPQGQRSMTTARRRHPSCRWHRSACEYTQRDKPKQAAVADNLQKWTRRHRLCGGGHRRFYRTASPCNGYYCGSCQWVTHRTDAGACVVERHDRHKDMAICSDDGAWIQCGVVGQREPRRAVNGASFVANSTGTGCVTAQGTCSVDAAKYCSSRATGPQQCESDSAGTHASTVPAAVTVR